MFHLINIQIWCRDVIWMNVFSDILMARQSFCFAVRGILTIVYLA